MDYHVFVVSRIREARLAGRTTRDAVVHGRGHPRRDGAHPAPGDRPAGHAPRPKAG
ncbi:hypothetical protein HYQ63_32255 [Streptomyces sp. Rer75]|nr:hypothetical protein [Streptomyces sp. Rer75]QLH24749.1 hypothetical protein HYQ63_32255 [Streptomyces sp. Rer75]